MKKWSLYYKVKGFPKLKIECVEAKTIREALDKFEAIHPFAIVQSIS